MHGLIVSKTHTMSKIYSICLVCIKLPRTKIFCKPKPPQYTINYIKQRVINILSVLIDSLLFFTGILLCIRLQ